MWVAWGIGRWGRVLELEIGIQTWGGGSMEFMKGNDSLLEKSVEEGA